MMSTPINNTTTIIAGVFDLGFDMILSAVSENTLEKYPFFFSFVIVLFLKNT